MIPIFSAIFLLKLVPSSCNVPYPIGLVDSEASPAKPMRTLVKLTSWKYKLFRLENLVLRTKSELNGFASKECELFWSSGVLEYWKKHMPKFQLELVLPSLHYSNRLTLVGKTSKAPSGGGARVLRARILFTRCRDERRKKDQETTHR